ncbi:hypothetical protein V6N11_038556 [Hibiscus sabdariffa]|uniref:Uncharacterized protein n=1 Tax=Hibiscus sabdariffa TaxID=183260 RepID=A0ABR2SKB6_9ROSI
MVDNVENTDGIADVAIAVENGGDGNINAGGGGNANVDGNANAGGGGNANAAQMYWQSEIVNNDDILEPVVLPPAQLPQPPPRGIDGIVRCQYIQLFFDFEQVYLFGRTGARLPTPKPRRSNFRSCRPTVADFQRLQDAPIGAIVNCTIQQPTQMGYLVTAHGYRLVQLYEIEGNRQQR